MGLEGDIDISYSNLMKNTGQLSFTKKIGFAVLGLYSVAIFCYGIYGALRSSSDQQTFYYTTKLLLEKKDAYKIGCDFIKTVPDDICYVYYDGIKEAGGYGLYPPSTHMLFIPFSGFALSPLAAKFSWFFWNLIFIAIIYFVILKKYLRETPAISKYLLLCLIIGASATKTNLSLGQTALFSCAAFLLTLYLKDKNKWLAGCAFALAVSKPSLMVLFALYMILLRQYRIFLMALVTHLVITLAVSAWIGVSPVVLINNYLQKVSLSFAHPGSLLVLQTAGISIKSILHFINIPASAKTIIIGFIYITAVIYIYIKRNHEELPVVGLIAFLTLLVDYHHHYDFAVLFVAFPLFLKFLTDEPKRTWPFFYYLFLLYAPNFSRFNLLGFETGAFFSKHTNYLFTWQIFYTACFVLLLYLYIKEFLQGAEGGMKITTVRR